MRTGIAAEAAAGSGLMKMAPQTKTDWTTLILGVHWPVLKETRHNIQHRLSIRDNKLPGCGNFWDGIQSCKSGRAIFLRSSESWAKRLSEVLCPGIGFGFL
jgi:hypothetical protein